MAVFTLPVSVRMGGLVRALLPVLGPWSSILWRQMPCAVLRKSYLRSTDAPDTTSILVEP